MKGTVILLIVLVQLQFPGTAAFLRVHVPTCTHARKQVHVWSANALFRAATRSYYYKASTKNFFFLMNCKFFIIKNMAQI